MKSLELAHRKTIKAAEKKAAVVALYYSKKVQRSRDRNLKIQTVTKKNKFEKNRQG